MKTGKRFLILAVLFGLFVFARGSTLSVKAAGTYTIYVNRKSNIVNVVNSKTGRLVRAMYCSTGKGYSTISGTYNTCQKYRWHVLQHNVWGQYCTRIYGGYLFHSVWYYSPSKTQMSRAEYNKLGTQASAGCVRLATVDAKWIYDHCGLGTKVVIGESRTLRKPGRRKLKLSTSTKTGWDPTDPDPSNPYYPKITLKKAAAKTIEVGSKFKPKKMIKKISSAFTSSKTMMKYVRIKGKVNTKKPGTYKITYTVTDPATQLTKSLTWKFKVKAKKKQQTAPEEATTQAPEETTTQAPDPAAAVPAV